MNGFVLRSIGLFLLGAAALAGGCGSGPPPAEPVVLVPASPETVETIPLPDPEPNTVPVEHREPGDLADLLGSPGGEATYRLRGGDVIRVTVYDHDDLTCRLRVPDSGPAPFPLIGEVELKERAVAEVEKEIRRRLEEKYVTLAPVTVLLESTRGETAYVLGSVARPGAYPFPPNGSLSLLQLVAKAGGFLEDADTDRLRLLRGAAEDRTFWEIPAKQIEQAGRIGLDVPLQDGDTLLVPSLPRIHVLGCVQKPGAIPARAGARFTLARVIAQSGGLAEGADRDRIYLVRRNPEGAAETVRLSFRTGENGGAGTGGWIVPGDTVIVREAARIYVLGQVSRPGGFRVTEESLTATKAISLAGGFTRRADSNGTVVIRTASGKQKILPVRVRSIVSRDSAQQVKLEPGDIVYVPERFF